MPKNNFNNLNTRKSEIFFINLFRDEKKYDNILSDEDFLEVVFDSKEEVEIAKQLERDTW